MSNVIKTVDRYSEFRQMPGNDRVHESGRCRANSRSVQIFCLVTAFVVGLLASSLVAQQTTTRKFDEPIRKYVISNQTLVHAGPSVEHYPTSTVDIGQSVAVYYETSNGWSGVMPLEGEFNWISADDAYLLPGGNEIEIADNPSPAWIGSHLGTPKSYKWMLQLQSTQKLRLLGEQRFSVDGGEEKLWYRVSPPQGEFRWIQTKNLSDQPIFAESSATSVAPSRVQSAGASHSHSQPIGTGVRTAQYTQSNEPTKNAEGSGTRSLLAPTRGSTADLPPPNITKPESPSNTPEPIRQSGSPETLGPDEQILSSGTVYDPSAPLGSLANPLDRVPTINDVDMNLQDGEFVVGSPSFVGDYFEPESISDAIGEGAIIVDGTIVSEFDAGYSDDTYSDIELGPGEFIVGEPPLMDDEYIDGEYIDGEYVDGSVVARDSHNVVRHGQRPSRNSDMVKLRQRMNQDPHHPHFAGWHSLNGKDGKMRVRPLASVLGMIGFAVREVEVTPPDKYRDRRALGSYETAKAGAHPSSRLDDLPRPTRRLSVDSIAESRRQSLRDSADRIGENVRDFMADVNALSNSDRRDPLRDEIRRELDQIDRARSDGRFLGDETGSEPSSSLDEYVSRQRRRNRFDEKIGDGLRRPIDDWHARLNTAGNETESAGRGILTSGPAGGGNASLLGPTNSQQNGSTGWNDRSSTDWNSLSEQLSFTTPALQEGYAALDQMLEGPAANWNLSMLAGFAREWVDQGATTLIRGEARLLLERIEQLEEVRKIALATGAATSAIIADRIRNAHLYAASGFNSDNFGNTAGYIPNPNLNSPRASQFSNVSLASADLSTTSSVANTNQSISPYAIQNADASGWLRPVAGQTTNNSVRPNYALTDASGSVIAYVTPAAGMNLGRFENQRVAVFGQRGVLPQLASRHVTAERIVRVE